MLKSENRDELTNLFSVNKNSQIIITQKQSDILDNDHERNGNSQDNKISLKTSFIQVMFSVIANLTMLSAGMGLAFPSVSLPALQDDTKPAFLNKEQASWFSSINMLFCPVGALLFSYVIDKYGRKYTLIFINVLTIISWGMLGTSHHTNSELMYYQILVARIIIGVTTGLSSVSASIYSAEIAHPTLRGRLIVFTAYSIAFGVLGIYVLGYCLQQNFRLICLICCGICILSLVLLIFIPETPNWLIMNEKYKKAKKSIGKLKGLSHITNSENNLIENEIDLIRKQNLLKRIDVHETIMEIIKKPEIYKPLGIMVGFFAFQQLCGIYVIMIYAVQFVNMSGIEINSFLCAVYIGLARVVGICIISFLLDTWGRKPPVIMSGIGMAICMFGLTTMKILNYNSDLLSLCFLLIFVLLSSMAFLTMPFTMIAEVFPQRYRGFGSGVTLCTAYIMSFSFVKWYPTILENIEPVYIYIFYGVIAVMGTIYVMFVVPETKGKSLEEIENSFRNKPSEIIIK